MKAIVFDIDRTLLDHDQSQVIGLSKYFENHPALSQSVVFEAFHRLWVDEGEYYLSQFFQGKMGLWEQRVERVKAVFSRCGIELNEEEARETFETFLEHYRNAWVLFSDVVETLETLQPHFRLGIISNGDGENQRRKLKQTGIVDFFEAIVISGEKGVHKPSEEIFHLTAAQFNLSPSDLTYVGDLLEDDAIAASSVGMNGVWLNRKGECIAGLAVQEVKDLHELTESLIQKSPA